ncbi:hypothetical protein JTE90_012528 [Oedothorax gibbosus]|uniref:Uncharacterized protein n=1 Tax=Oedothorax gibbosus TaxID=931172 RepID=A0AAV6V060_9ARAC|nr:hypothetical protein JTE90_012528 [Oedothorax gibbosus]
MGSALPIKFKYVSTRDVFSRSPFFVPVIVMCAASDAIRNVMLAADDLGMIDSGEYAFFNVEIYTRTSQKFSLVLSLDD